MGLNSITIGYAELSKDYYLRNDEKYHRFLKEYSWDLFDSKTKSLVPLREILFDDYKLFLYEDGETYKGIPTGRTFIDEDGDIIDFQPVTCESHPGRLKYQITNENILISSLRLAKSPALYFENKDLSEYVFSNGYYIFRVNKEWNRKFVLYLLRVKRLKKILDNHLYRGIGISAYKKEDLLRIRIPKVSLTEQNRVVLKIEQIEKRINQLKIRIKPVQSIINCVFSREFNFDIDKVYEIEKIKNTTVSSELTFKNVNLRSSVRWNKILPLQRELYKNISCLKKLGSLITKTKNGWSPNCRETDTENYVFSVNSISKDTYMTYEDLKMTNEVRKNIKEYYAKEDDLFISRGNTVDLVALASVVKNLPIDKNIIFPDLFIRIEVDEKQVLREYLAYLFNSIIGRLYFKYATKGKNQTMVKVSGDELNNFYLPIPSLKKQKSIIEEISSEFKKQDEIRDKIRIERNKIENLVQASFK